MARKDINQTAFSIVQIATGEVVIDKETDKVIASRKGGITGGRARAAALTPERKSAIAKKAALARWSSKKT